MAVVHETCPLREPHCTHITLGRVTGSCCHLSPVGNLNKFSLVEAMKIQHAYWAVSLLASRDLFLSGLFLQDAHHPPYQFQVSFLVGTTLEPEVCISKHSGVNKECTWGSTQIVDNQRWRKPISLKAQSKYSFIMSYWGVTFQRKNFVEAQFSPQ